VLEKLSLERDLPLWGRAHTHGGCAKGAGYWRWGAFIRKQSGESVCAGTWGAAYLIDTVFIGDWLARAGRSRTARDRTPNGSGAHARGPLGSQELQQRLGRR
jgi:hypothetical protein